MYEKTLITKRSSLVRLATERPLVDFALTAYRAMWDDSPSAKQWMSWVRSFAHFGRMVGNGLALRNSKKLRTAENRAHYFQSSEFDFYEFWEAGRKRGVLIANRSLEFFEQGDFSDAARAQFIADVAFDGTLADPLGLYGPKLPALAPYGQKEQAAA
jgi:hypothetical protein